tara:strand:- start:121 stop:795 length:675 start_codon:yes stop_codon:yes gene_type:complete
MKHVLIASVLTVLMTLPAVAQQRRPQGPAKPPSGTPGKLEVPQKLGPAFKNAIEAHKAVIRAQIAALQALKKLNLEVKGYQGGRASEGWKRMSPDAKAKIGEKGGATQGPQSQKEKLTEFNPYGLQGGTPKKEKLSESNPFALQTRAQNEYLRVESLTRDCVNTGTFGAAVQSKIESQVGKVSDISQIDAAIGKLNTQLNTVPVVGFLAAKDELKGASNKYGVF